jgi:phosphate transport system protein
MPRAHSDRSYDAELSVLRDQISQMANSVVDMIAKSRRAFIERDGELAQEMIDFDQEIDRLEVQTDELCLGILARRQPVASDLRFIAVVLKLVTDLERIGDLCVNICERVLELGSEDGLPLHPELGRMAELIESMVRDAMQAFMARDAKGAEEVIAQDREVDALNAQLFQDLLTQMVADSKTVFRATRVQAIAKHLERIGDHATNLGEMVVFLVRGKDIRHFKTKKPTQRRPSRGL